MANWTSSVRGAVGGNVESQYLIGAASVRGHSMSHHSSGRGVDRQSSRCAGRTRTAAKRERIAPRVPWRHVTPRPCWGAMTARGVMLVRDPGRWIRSIRGRLIFAYTASALATLVVAIGFVYWALASSLKEEDEEFLADHIRVLRWILQEHPDDQLFLHEEVMEER